VHRSSQRSCYVELDGYSSWKDQGGAIVGTTIDIIQKVETCCLEGRKKHSEWKHTSRIIRLLYGGTVMTVSEPSST